MSSDNSRLDTLFETITSVPADVCEFYSFCREGQLDQAIKLLDTIDVNPFSDNNQAIRGATAAGQNEIVQYIVEQNRFPLKENALDVSLVTAAKRGNANLVDYLLKKGANPFRFSSDITNQTDNREQKSPENPTSLNFKEICERTGLLNAADEVRLPKTLEIHTQEVRIRIYDEL